MDFASPLVRARFLRREKRFFVFAERDGQEVVAHCPNTGSLKGVLEHTSHVWLLPKDGTGKLKFSAEIAEFADGTMVGIHPARANALAREALESGLLGLQGEVKQEAKYDAETRFDFRVGDAWVEVKSVSMAHVHQGGPVALFPDSVSSRGLKHLGILADVVKNGGKALQVYVVQRADCTAFAPAEMIDPAYAGGLRAAVAAGVPVVALACEVTPGFIRVSKRLEISL
ncbi:MAG TPA: DNA/RNA nuclease SfsA [Alphaproteobacteria bacterium]|nr:DNA/RNA nuclease SfsA [Alphaproteobacteria bacterium]